MYRYPGNMDDNCILGTLRPSESDCLDVLSRFISCLSGYDETELIPKDAAVFLRRVRLEGSDAASTGASKRLLHQAHSAAVSLARSIQDGLAYLNGQKGTVYSANIQLKKPSGIDALPDDIIAMVAEQVYANSDQLMVIRFSHVCQRWRNVALSFPQLWGSPSPSFDRALVQTLLARSRATPLDINLQFKSEMTFDDDFLRYFDDVKPHFGRCRSFGLLLGEDSDEEKALDFAEDLGTNCDGLYAPVLETLDIDCQAFQNRHASLDEGLHFYASWNMPRLRSLRITNFVPRPVFGNSLKSLKAEFTMHSRHEDWDMKLFLDFLASVPQLEELSIILLNSTLCFFDSDNLSQRNGIVLAHVTRLTLDLYDGQNDESSALQDMLRWIITPHVTALTLRIDVSPWSELDEFLKLAFGDTNDDRFVHVESLNIHIRQYQGIERCRMERIFFKLPRLAELSLSTEDGAVGTALWDLPNHGMDSFYTALGRTPPPVENPVPLPPLRVVRLSGFREGPNFDFDVARKLAYAMKEGKYWEQLERLEIIGCPSFNRTKDQLEETIPRGKLLWID